MADLVKQAETYYGSPGQPTVDVNHHRFAPTMYVTRNSDPLVNFDSENCQGKGPGWDTELKANHLSRIRIPSHAVPDNSADASMVLYNADTDELTETWVTKKHANGRWTACWGGTLRNASKSTTGAFTWPYGAAASGLPLSATMIRADELKRGRIDHSIYLAIPWVKAWPALSWPATRTDGGTQGRALTMGQMLRLPADLDIDALKLSPSARTIAKAAQEYGIMIGDSSGSVAFGAQNPASLGSDPYPEIFRGRWAMHEMQGDPARGEGRFPLDKLQALPVDYKAPVSGGNPSPSASPTPSRTPTPSTTPTVSPTPTPRPTPSPTPAPPQVLRRLDAGGVANNGWAAGNGFTGGWTHSVNQSINVSRASNPAPVPIYQSEHAGMSSHVTTGLQAGHSYKVRLHFAEIWWTETGARRFNVSANDRQILKDFDIVAAAGGPNTAVIREANVVADSQGRIRLDFTRVVDQASIAGIEITSATSPSASPTPSRTPTPSTTPTVSPTPTPRPTPSPTPAPPQVLRRLDAGAGANSGWAAGNGFTGGWTYSVNQSINVSRASNPAPVPIYQSEHAGMSQHVTTGLQPGQSYKVRLHFAEIWWTQTGARRFNVSANGQQILANFDIVAAAGGPNTAVIREATVVADSQGRIRLDFTNVVDQASIAGIEILTS